MKKPSKHLVQPHPKTPLDSLYQFAFALLLLMAAAPPAAMAQATPTPPERMSYQGFVTDGNGGALGTNAPKNYDVIFRIWNDQSATAAANRLWAEQQTVTVDKGYFSVLLGEGSQFGSEPHTNLSGLFVGSDASERYVEFTVKGIGTSGADVTILPRLKLLSSPYAFLAKNAGALLSPNGASLVTSANGQLTVNGTITGDGSGLANLNASQITSGTLPGGRLGGTYSGAVNLSSAGNSFTGNGSGLTALSAGNITAGSLSDARLSANVALRAGGNTFSGNQTITSGTLYLDNSQYMYGKNAAGVYEGFLIPRWSDNVTYLNYGVGGFNIRNNASNSRMFLTDAGNVGIGTTGPGAQLHVYGGGVPSAILESTSTAGTWISLRNDSTGGNNWNLISSGSGNGEGAGKLLFNDQTSGGTIMTIESSGRIGIGTASPTKGSLEIDTANGVQPGYNPAGFLNTSGGHNGSIGSGGFISMWAVGWVMADTYVAFSDERIKNIQDQSDSAADLKTLLGIKVTDYTYKDTIARGNRPQKKVVAQQVERVYPQAVSQTTDVVPDIYRNATLKNGWVQLATDLKVGERVKLIGEKEKGIYAVLEVRDGAFRTEFRPGTDKVFVYGREVKDFRTVDYEAISMLNVSATQELAKRLEALEASQAHLSALDQKAGRVDALEREVAGLKKMVAQLAETSRASKQTAQETPESLPSAAVASLQRVSATVSLDR